MGSVQFFSVQFFYVCVLCSVFNVFRLMVCHVSSLRSVFYVMCLSVWYVSSFRTVLIVFFKICFVCVLFHYLVR